MTAQLSTDQIQPAADPRLKMVRRISKLMDEEFVIGKFKFGLDPILNFIPYAGDISTYLISVVLIITMLRHGASGRLVARMLLNASLDALIGVVPVLGWIFDFTYKANTRNVNLLTQHYTEGKHKGSAFPVLMAVLLVVVLVLGLMIWLLIKVFRWLDSLLVF